MSIKNLWKYSRLRFYLLNARWNYSFLLFSKRKYVDMSYVKINPINQKREKVIKKRFVGYDYKGTTYQDNPGMPIPDRDVWAAWKKKGLIK